MSERFTLRTEKQKPVTYESVQETGGIDRLQIEQIIADPRSFLDEGGAGAVHALTPQLCIKKFKEKYAEHLHDRGNTPAEEARIMGVVDNHAFRNVRSPHVFGTVRGLDNATSVDILMERLRNAETIQRLTENKDLPSDFDRVRFLETIDLEKVEMNFNKYLTHLHDEVGIAHGDIASRNIMIDLHEYTETPNVYLIDYGRSVQNDPQNGERVRRFTKACDDDWKQIDALFQALEEAINAISPQSKRRA